jgi:small subunit ribosomal protein S8
MSLVDPISDMLTRIRNAYLVGHEEVCVSASKIKEAILGILKENGYIEDFKREGKEICVTLKYENFKPVVTKIERVSTPGRRFYVKKDEIPTVLSGRGIAVISTSKGLMTGDNARRENLGGEIICKVY